ncbi:MAG TPA: hypothetical protein VFI11_12095 [Anaerolineales bacterium]|nr:hypothetical protein [Anaerolineales bacterium]
MYAEKCDLRGKRGVQRLERIGPYSVIANRALHEEGKSSRFAVVNEPEAWVDSVHPSEARAISTAQSLAQ